MKKEHCEPSGIFKEYSNLKFDIEELSDFMVVRFKSSEYNIKYISIKLKDDVLGFPNFDEDSYQNHYYYWIIKFIYGKINKFIL